MVKIRCLAESCVFRYIVHSTLLYYFKQISKNNNKQKYIPGEF